ncbi:hypothetical protein INT80_03475 [Gallibacterium anatis]|uniref:Uncharacterized protein n=1 Tax=Gallibacterium anatis TaxID=750 RepID=A0A930UW81_9PAST|nr:hypothetical protein [Gallibacterium anatis]
MVCNKAFRRILAEYQHRYPQVNLRLSLDENHHTDLVGQGFDLAIESNSASGRKFNCQTGKPVCRFIGLPALNIFSSSDS